MIQDLTKYSVYVPLLDATAETIATGHERKTHRFDNKYVDPYFIVEMLDNGNARIRIRENRTRIMHINRLRKAYYGESG
ncbi:hypothetical protein ALC53_00025 [Atta colombica]|uniref:Uncharacterized protein n=1 Tax=Atta colombica TaxID=520822 RepID=A0A151K277_9HYME|nr:hypothetical protein ALC53_00025 [Atta colombica]